MISMQHQVMKGTPRGQPNDTAREVERKQDKKISGSGHFGLQLMHYPNSKLPATILETSYFSSDHLTSTKLEELLKTTAQLKTKLCVDDDKPLCELGGLREGDNLGKLRGTPNDLVSISTLGNGTHFNKDDEVPSAPQKTTKDDSSNARALKHLPWIIKQSPNEPHPLLDFPPLYFMVRKCPRALEAIKTVYQVRWRVSYPLQRRVYFSQYLRELGIFCTWGELFLLLPFIAMVIGGILFTFSSPSVFWSGHIARLALILAIATAVRNSFVTLLLGLPFERALWYHKLSGRIAFIMGLLHTAVAHSYALEKAFLRFLFADQMNSSGAGLAMLCGGVVMTSFPQIRKKAFELFYYAHLIFVALMTVCAFYHSGTLIPVLASLVWGSDLFCRKVVMACCRYPRKARIRVLSDTVVELSFPKTKNFDYNPGQHLSVAVPDLSIFEWHPFSIATCPRQKVVTILVRVAGDWTLALYKLAKTRDEISILVEGPNGNPNVDIFNEERYKSFLLFGGGIGITPIQSVCHQLVYDQSKGRRDLERIRVIWTERDPVLMRDVDVIHNGASCHFSSPLTVDDLDIRSLASDGVFREDYDDNQYNSMASALMALVPPSKTTDAELEQDYPMDQSNAVEDLVGKNVKKEEARQQMKIGGVSVADESTFPGAFTNPTIHDILDMQVYLTSEQASKALSKLPFVHSGRPDVDKIFTDTRKEALARGLSRVAVFVCAPVRLASLLQSCCVKFSDEELQFDIHLECQD